MSYFATSFLHCAFAHASSFASKKYQIEENKTDVLRKVSESTAWTFEMVLLLRQGERVP